MLDVVKKIKEMGAARINISVTFGLLLMVSKNLKAYEDGLFVRYLLQIPIDLKN